MEIRNLPFGDISRFELASAGGQPFPNSFRPGDEIELTRMTDGLIYASRPDETAPDVLPVQATGQTQKLDSLLVRNWPRLSWVVQRTGAAVLVQVHEFITRHAWTEELQIGLEENVVDDLRSKIRKPAESAENLATWLDERLIVRSRTRKPRFFLSNDVSASEHTFHSFRLHGPALTVDVKRKGGQLLASRIVHAKRGADYIAWVEGDLRFCDATKAGMLAESIAAQMEKILEGADSYLSLWRNYMDFEKERLARVARQIGIIQYNRFERKLEDAFVFYIATAQLPELKGLLQAADNEDVVLAASAEEPSLSQPEQPSSTFRRGRGRKKARPFLLQDFSGRCGAKDIDVRRGTIRLHSTSLFGPPANGFLRVLQSGSQAVLERREAAEMKIRTGTCPMPQLALLLENQPVPIAQRRWIDPITPRVLGHYPDGPPTERQKKAIEIAINTPDIAVIQGPPGTGKTEVIAAIIKRLEELADPEESPEGSFLITSFQHVAVANVSERVMAYGLPPVKTGRPGDASADSSQTWADRWRMDTADHIERELVKLPEGEGILNVRKLRELTESYSGGHHELSGTARMLRTAAGLASGLASGAECDRLRELAFHLESAEREGSSRQADKRQNAYRAVLALRYEPGPFADDGPLNARTALVRLKEFGLTLPAELERLLGRAAMWNRPETPPFLLDLGRLRDELLRELAPETRPLAVRLAPRSDVRELLSTVLESADRKLRSSAQGLALVVGDYLRELREDPPRVEGALSRYTAVLAETCQASARASVMKLQQKWPEPGFETVVVDEAARANPLDLFIPMAQARRRIILVGDQNQLPHNLEPALERELEESWDDARTERLRESLFEKLYRDLGNRESSDRICRTVMLDTQYRMPPVLGDFISNNFYEGSLKSGLPPEKFRHGMPTYRKGERECVAAWIDVPHNKGSEESAKSRFRTVEVRRLVKEVELIRRENRELSIGIVSFYSAQVALISDELKARKNELEEAEGEDNKKLLVGTVDAFQGRQFDVVLLSMTRSNNYGNRGLEAGTAEERAERSKAMARKRYGFLILANRMCVALSRQRRLLVVVGDRAMMRYPEAEDYRSIRALKDFGRLCEGDYGRVFR